MTGRQLIARIAGTGSLTGIPGIPLLLLAGLILFLVAVVSSNATWCSGGQRREGSEGVAVVEPSMVTVVAVRVVLPEHWWAIPPQPPETRLPPAKPICACIQR